MCIRHMNAFWTLELSRELVDNLKICLILLLFFSEPTFCFSQPELMSALEGDLELLSQLWFHLEDFEQISSLFSIRWGYFLGRPDQSHVYVWL